MNGWIAAVSAFAALLLLISACCAVDPFVPQMQPKIDNHSVSPPDSKTWDQPFKYTGNFSFPYVVDLTLEVYDLSVGEWCPVESGNSTEIENEKWQIVWENVRVCSGTCSGTSRYRFKYNGSVLKYVDGTEIIYKGPKILEKRSNGGNGGTYYGSEMRYINATVDPNWVFIGVRERKTFNYSVIVDEDVTLILEIYNLSSKEWEDKGEGAKSKQKGMWSKWKHNWTVNLTLDANWQGISQYQFYPKDRYKSYESQIYYGPEIKKEEERLSGWKKEIGFSDKKLRAPAITCDPVSPSEERWFKQFTYTAHITHPDRAQMTVALFVDTDELVPWKRYKDNAIIKKEDYENGVATVKWVSEGIFDENDVNQPPYEYYIWYWDGYNQYDREKGKRHVGPDNVHGNYEPTVTGSVTPGEGTFLDFYKYTAYITDENSDDTVYVTLYAQDPLNRTVLLGEKPVKVKDGEGNATWIVPSENCPDLFTAENLVNKSFLSSFYFEYSDEGMERTGMDKKQSDTIEGPDVKPANVTFMGASVTPETGKYSDRYTYEAKFYSSEENTITATLYIYDPSNLSEYKKYPKNDSRKGDITITWPDISPDIFGPDDFNKTSNYTIVWRDEIVYTKEKEEGPWEYPRITKGIPIVGGVALPVALIIVVPLLIPSMLFLPSLFGRGKRDSGKPSKREKMTQR